MSGRSELATRIKKLRGDLTQGEFAEAVGIPQPKFYEYEAGTKRPGFKPLVKLGFYALDQRRNDEADWFFNQSGIDMDSLREIDELIKKNARDTVSSGIQIANVLPHPRVLPEGKHAGSAGYLQPLPAWMISKHGYTFYVRATDDFIVPFRRGDLILVDGSEMRLSNLLDSFVVAYRPNHFSDGERTKLERNWAKPLSLEEAKRRRDRRQFPFLRTGVFVGRLTRGEIIGGSPAIEIRTASGDTLLEYLPVVAPGDRKGEGIHARYTELQVLGRAVGWLSAPISLKPVTQKRSGQ